MKRVSNPLLAPAMAPKDISILGIHLVRQLHVRADSKLLLPLLLSEFCLTKNATSSLILLNRKYNYFYSLNHLKINFILNCIHSHLLLFFYFVLPF